MRMLVMTAAASALLTMTAEAQQMMPGQAPWQSLPKMDNSAQDDQRPAKKTDDTAYRSAVDSIPAPKQANDPWGDVRAKPQSKNSR